ncbi:Hypothetical protein SRAE_X000241600 [Strongyloides ratti]|uniref:Uncharacterized protein n=1 Tax=Strongyloides ratti TaxID=34506 RepID=A0A090MR80_STRRB|nr:Hypothetical protein SRAE_X000241600 [Strongyloides ratti]CEF60683.1 Hypothetical protein SRAE_X000241600 [Strongyloides ratti]
MDMAKGFGMSKLTDFFGKKDFSTKDLEPNNLKDLTSKVLMTGELINVFQKSKNDLMNVANDQQKGALAKLGDVKNIFMNFKKTMDENPGSFTLLKDNWKGVVEQVFKANNLQVLIPLLGKINSSSGTYFGMVTLLFPLVAAFILRNY